MATPQPLCSRYRLLNNFCYHPVLDINTTDRRQTAIYKHVTFLMQSSAELCIPHGSTPSWEKITTITSAWKQRKHTSETASYNSGVIFSLERDCCTYSENQHLYNPFTFLGMKSPTYNFHLKISSLSCLVLSSCFLLTNSPSNEDTSGFSKQKELTQSFEQHHWAQSSACSVLFLALCLLSIQQLKPLGEGAVFVLNKAIFQWAPVAYCKAYNTK